eukprot:gb/GEZJ01005679.1/.p1 GENE.gb/GEZJ01005679.1/~~gb/GEZJ01005679.1/.p1  ORF type:complete len:483 (-),score=57.62 gb/GEZJ01005679.1/:143-1591(-)
MKLSTPTAVGGMIVFGTACSLLAKLIYSVQAPNIYGGQSNYEKPWLQVLAMFTGMSICILLDLPRRRAHARQPAADTPATPTEERLLLVAHSPDAQKPPASVWIISIPTLFDLFATACGTTGLLYTTVSVYQMLRGAMLVWTAILSIVFLKRRLTTLNYAGIVLCVVGIVMVGLANIWVEQSSASRNEIIFGITVILVGQVLQAAQTVMEEFLLQDLQMSSVRVVAWEGLFGMAHCLLWVFPIVYLLPGGDHGHLEDVLDAFYMLTHSWAVAGIILTDMTMMLFYNVFGMEVTDSLSAVHRVVIETLRTLAVWIADLVIFYLISGRTLGEPLTQYSWLQLLGFCVLVMGTILYNFDNLKADYDKRRAKKHVRVLATVPEMEVVSVGEYGAMEVMEERKKAFAAVPLAVGGDEEWEEDEGEEGEEEGLGGSYYGQTVGSASHSSYLLATATPPLSLSSSLVHRRGGQHGGQHGATTTTTTGGQ